jgi:hypothetical protein
MERLCSSHAFCEGQEATVLQLPAETHTAEEAKKREPGPIVA